MTIRAVLFDVGGPIDTEVRSEAIIDGQIRDAFACEGVPVDEGQVVAASDWAVSVFAPDTYAAMIWRLAAGDAALADRVYRRFHDDGARLRRRLRGGIELRDGIPELLRRLDARGLKLGLAANQPAQIIAELDRWGVGQLFAHREVSGHHGFRKPDVRLFLRACEDLGVAPAETIMVGDRIDNDIVPARLLGMRTVLLRTGRHSAQQPRCAADLPDEEVHDVPGMEAAIVRLADLG